LNEQLAVKFDASTTLYVMGVVPGGKADPLARPARERVYAQLSLAATPEYATFSFPQKPTVEPTTTGLGQITTGDSVSVIVTVTLQVAELPD